MDEDGFATREGDAVDDTLEAAEDEDSVELNFEVGLFLAASKASVLLDFVSLWGVVGALRPW